MPLIWEEPLESANNSVFLEETSWLKCWGSPPSKCRTSWRFPFFNGIGGSFRCYDMLGIKPLGLIAFDTLGPAQRITSRRWPPAELHGDVRTIDKAMIERWMFKYPEVSEPHIWGGFPCVDLSSVKAGGKGLDGPQSSLFFELPRIINLAKETVPKHVTVRYTAENVASMQKGGCEKITDTLGVYPYHLNCADAVPMQRPRLCWCSELLEGSMEGLEFEVCSHWTEVKAVVPYPLLEDWVEPGYSWPGGEGGQTLLTALKSIARTRPPPSPAGIKRCDSDCLARYQADSFRFPPYHYLERFLFWKNDRWRLANSEEKELLLGYGYKHTSLCWPASKIKGAKRSYEDERLSLLGDSFSIFSFAIVAAASCKKFLPSVHYKAVAARMGLAPGFLAPFHCQAPLQRRLQYGSTLTNDMFSVKELNQILLTKTNHTGSDIKVTTGEILNPKAAARQSVPADWWDCQGLFRFHWKTHEHINCLELRAILQAIKYYTSHLRCSHARVFHITDSYICMSVLAKGHTGSKMLARILKQINAYLLGYNIYCILAHVESSENPTDGASRL